jgi:nuclear pore complex protein Nup188
MHTSDSSCLLILKLLQSSYKKFGLPGGGISITTTQSAVRCACKSLQSAVDSLPPEVDNSGVLFPPLSGQVELLLTITRILLDHAKQSKSSRHLYPVIVLLMKTSGASTSFLFNLMPSSPALKQPVKSLLVLLLSLFEFIYKKVDMKDGSEDVNIFGELSLLSMSLLPVLCKLAESREYFDLAIASMDIILKGFLPSNVWVPILQKHFRLQVILQKCQSGALLCTQVILNFLLTMGRTKDGAKILQSANIFAFIKVLLSQMSLDDSCLRNSLSTQTKDVKIWGLGLAIVSSLNHCMDDDISRNSVANSTISFLSGQVPLMSSYLSAQSVNTHQSKKRTLLQKSQTSLSALSLTENILTLLCILAKYHFPRDTGMKEVDSELREIIIHLLAFISRGSERTGDSPNWNLSFGCPPIIKEEMKLNEEPPLIRSKYGWFRFAASCTLSTPSVSGPPNAGLSLVIRDKNPADSDSMKQTRFTEMLAVQIYRIAFLIMKFLCSQAKEAVRRAEELEFLDLAHFPELPMPDILHGLQDQVVSIVTEVLEANVSTALNTETERVCQLLLVILETSLYMELCVSQSCGIRPVMGRFEDFSKGIKAMVHGKLHLMAYTT